jgi:hypothetical protein
MKLHLVLCSALLLTAAIVPVQADPILPYQQPIAQQLTNDIEGGGGNVNTLNKALDTFHRNSKSLNGDISILRDLNTLLASEPNYPTLLANAADAYLTDFQGRRDALREQLRPAPRSKVKDSANRLLQKIDRALATAEVATATSDQIKSLGTAAAKFPQASNTVQRALRQPIGLSSMVARIGALRFTSSKGFIAGGTNFHPNIGAVVGEFTKGVPPDTGVLDISGIDNGSIVRGIHLHVEGITTNSPVTYPLAIGENSAFYDATDVPRRREYHFQGDSLLTNATVTNAFLTIDFLNTNYILGRFAFMGTNGSVCPSCDTNRIVTIHEGEFQLNLQR